MGSPELTLDCRFSPESRKTIADIFNRSLAVSEKIPELEDYANRLREEMNKIDAFKRELPLCMLLLTDAIVAMEGELSRYRKSITDREFMQLKKSEKTAGTGSISSSEKDKIGWMSSVQLWNFDLNNNKEVKEKTTPMVMGRENRYGLGRPKPSSLSLTPEIGKKSREGIIGFSPKSCSSNNNDRSNVRKQRRCWSLELHSRFTNALRQLGGAQAATPKQIRELMGVDGLTNDEVKSHLQKYRLHAQRLSS